MNDILKENIKKAKEEKNKIENSKSYTKPVLAIWFCIFPLFYFLEAIFNTGLDIQYILYGVFGSCVAYMTGEYSNDLVRNFSMPTGIGKIENIDQHKNIVFIWIAYTIITFLFVYIAKKLNMQLSETIINITNKVAFFAILLSIEYVAGNKMNKASVFALKKDRSDIQENINEIKKEGDNNE